MTQEVLRELDRFQVRGARRGPTPLRSRTPEQRAETAQRLAAVFSSRSDEWATPPDLFAELDREFHFNLDPCSTPENAKCNIFFTKTQNGLEQDWSKYGSVFVNPPYTRQQIPLWVQKGYEESRRGATVVMLIPARTDTRWYHDYILGKSEIRFIRRRLSFKSADPDEPEGKATFPSMIVIWRPTGEHFVRGA